MKMTVAKRITLTMAAVSTLVLIGGLLGIWSVQKTGNATDDIVGKAVPLADNAMEMNIDVLAQADTLAEYGLQVDPAKLPALEKQFNLHTENHNKHEAEIDKYIQFAVYGKEELKKICDEEKKNEEAFTTNAKEYMEHCRKLLEYRDLKMSKMGEHDAFGEEISKILIELAEKNSGTTNNIQHSAKDLEIDLFAANHSSAEYLLSGEKIAAAAAAAAAAAEYQTKYEGEFKKHIEEFKSHLEQLVPLATSAENKARADRISQLFSDFVKSATGKDGLFELHQHHVSEIIETKSHMALIDEAFAKDLQLSNKIEELASKNMQESMVIADRAQTMANLSIIIVSILVVLACIGIGIMLAKGIIGPLRELTTAAEIIGKGDLTAGVTVVRQDELGKLADVFRGMVTNLKNIITQVLQTSERVSSSSQQLSSSAQEMNATTEEVSSTVQQIAKGAETTAQRVEETSKVMEQMNTSVSQVATSAQSAASASAQANQSAQQGGKAAKEAVEKMNRIYETVTASSVVVKKLGERSEQISDIINVITGIADQTNLLALNAAIEAARAGEAGRGFAVVADEVRKLAEGSAKAADQIAKLIKEIQKETLEAVTAMQSGSKEVTEGREVIAKAGEALNEIIKAAENNASMVEQISAASQQMSAGTKQVVKSVDDIASTAEEAASATEEASASTEEMTASMQEMSASAQELAEMGINLRDMVSKFKVTETESGPKPTIQPKEEKFVAAKKSVLTGKLEANRKRFEELRKKEELHQHKEGKAEDRGQRSEVGPARNGYAHSVAGGGQKAEGSHVGPKG